VAPLYRSDAMSSILQPPFLNTVAWFPAARVAPLELLALAKSLEKKAGRCAGPMNGPRPLDIDVLLYGAQTMDLQGLSIPHPRLRQRPFVLAPLAALLPDLRLPPDGSTPGDLLAALPEDPSLERLPWGPRGVSSSPPGAVW
jgi:2-amino-4-hydroxy-6-hydroxymethyldihydropteridine diphosphokinase